MVSNYLCLGLSYYCGIGAAHQYIVNVLICFNSLHRHHYRACYLLQTPALTSLAGCKSLSTQIWTMHSLTLSALLLIHISQVKNVFLPDVDLLL